MRFRGRQPLDQRLIAHDQSARPRPAGDAVGDLVKPARHGLAFADRARFAHQDQERGLERVFDILLVVEQSLTQPENHGAMPPHQKFERRLIAAANEPVEQLHIGDLPRQRRRDPVQEVVQERIEAVVRHERTQCDLAPV